MTSGFWSAMCAIFCSISAWVDSIVATVAFHRTRCFRAPAIASSKLESSGWYIDLICATAISPYRSRIAVWCW